MSRFTLDSATEFLFGDCVESLHAPLPYPHNAPKHLTRAPNDAELFSIAFLGAQEVIARRLLNPLWQLTEIREDKTKEHMDVVSRYIDPIIKKAVQKKQERKRGGNPGKEADLESVGEDDTLLDHLVNLTDGM